MLTMNIRFDAGQVAKAFGELQQEHPNVMAQAINDTTREVRDAQVAAIRASFDNPTAFTLRALRTTFATRSKLQAMVWLKDGTSRAHYLIPQIEGGKRPLKRFEEILVQAGLMRKNERAVPGAGAKLDAYGNMGRGQIVQILSQLQAFNLAGSDANATGSKRSKAKRSKVEYFVAHGGESRQGREAVRAVGLRKKNPAAQFRGREARSGRQHRGRKHFPEGGPRIGFRGGKALGQ